jgi:predicted DCC family thiol-disulfide oxidoreductase YuxK
MRGTPGNGAGISQVSYPPEELPRCLAMTATRVPSGEMATVYDGWCGVCTRTAERVRRHDTAGRMLTLPSQSPGILDRVGLTRVQADAAAWTFAPDGRRFAGAAAINRTLRELHPWWWPMLARLYTLPILGWCEDRFYAWFARHRGRFARWGSTPACERTGAACEPPGEV